MVNSKQQTQIGQYSMTIGIINRMESLGKHIKHVVDTMGFCHFHQLNPRLEVLNGLLIKISKLLLFIQHHTHIVAYQMSKYAFQFLKRPYISPCRQWCRLVIFIVFIIFQVPY